MLERPSGGKNTKLMVVVDRSGFPIAMHVASASPHEVRLTEETLKRKHVRKSPEKLIGDKAHDSDPLDQRLKAKGIELIAPHKEIILNHRRKMVVNFVGINADGKSNACLLGFRTIAELLFVMSIIRKIIWPLFNWDASLFYSESIYEIASSNLKRNIHAYEQ